MKKNLTNYNFYNIPKLYKNDHHSIEITRLKPINFIVLGKNAL